MLIDPSARLVQRSDVTSNTTGDVLTGGSPMRILRLSPVGAGLVRGWLDGESIGSNETHQQLAWRLVDRGLADLRHLPSATGPLRSTELTVVIPVKDDHAGLVRTLKALGNTEGLMSEQDTSGAVSVGLPVTVIDDGSTYPIRLSVLRGVLGPTPALDITVVRQNTNKGPAAARNLGVKDVKTPLVAFIDSGVEISPTKLDILQRELVDPTTVIVAPRVTSTDTDRLSIYRQESDSRFARKIADYERRWSPLDLGPEAGVVGSERKITYVPSTCLVAKLSAIQSAGGFATELRFGEDVDLIWRCSELGWTRYVPAVEVSHPPRSTATAFADQRFRYGTSAGLLARRHPKRLSPLELSPPMFGFWAAALSGRRGGLLVAAAIAVRTWRKLELVAGRFESDPATAGHRAGKLAANAIVGSGLGLASASARTWSAGLFSVAFLRWLAGTNRGRAVSVLCRLAAIGLLRRANRSRPTTSIGDVAIGAVDDLSYSVGVWHGAAVAKTIRPLTPRFRSSTPEPARKAKPAATATGR